MFKSFLLMWLDAYENSWGLRSVIGGIFIDRVNPIVALARTYLAGCSDTVSFADFYGTLNPEQSLLLLDSITSKTAKSYHMVIEPWLNLISCSEVVAVLEKLPEANRVAFARDLAAKITNGNQLAQVLGQLPVGSPRVVFARHFEGKITYGDELAAVLGQLPKEERVAFANVLAAKIRDGNELAAVLEQLFEEKRVAFANVLAAEIRNGYELAVVLKQLPEEEDRVIFANSLTAKIRDWSELVAVLRQLPEGRNRVAYANYLVSTIKDGYELVEVLRCLPTEAGVHLAFAMRFTAQIKSGSELAQVLRCLPKAERLPFFKEFSLAPPSVDNPFVTAWGGPVKLSLMQLVKQISELIAVLSELAEVEGTEAERVTFARYLAGKITNGIELAAVLGQLPVGRAREDFVNDFGSIIKNGDELAWVLSRLPVGLSRVAFARDLAAKITNGNELAQVLSLLPEGEGRVAFARDLAAKIIHGYDLALVLLQLPEEQRVAFAENLAAKIKTVEELIRVLGQLPEEKRLSFAIESKRYIRTIIFIGNLNNLLKELPEEHRLTFVIAFKEKIPLDVFVKKLESFSPDPVITQKALAERITDGNELAAALFYLKDMSFLDVKILVCLPNIQAKIQNSNQLLAVCFHMLGTLPLPLPENFIEEYVGACSQACFRSYEDLKQFFEECTRLGILSFSESSKKLIIDQCKFNVRIGYLISIKAWDVSLFNDFRVQQQINLGLLDPNLFLFGALVDSRPQIDFKFFLAHPLCSLDATNERGFSLELAVKNSDLPPSMKAERLELITAARKSRLEFEAAKYIGVNLSKIPTMILSFTRDLPVVYESRLPKIDGVEPDKIKRFFQLTAWLKAQPSLAGYLTHLSLLERNDAFRALILFEETLEKLETFSVVMAQYLERQKVPSTPEGDLAHHLAGGMEQLGGCAEGVQYALTDMACSLDPQASLINAINQSRNEALIALIKTVGIARNMEVHTSVDKVARAMGVDLSLSYDAHRLPIADQTLQMVAQFSVVQFLRKYLPAAARLDSPGLLAVSGAVMHGGLIDALEADWFKLNALGLVPSYEGSAEKCVAVLLFVSDADRASIDAMIEHYISGEETRVEIPLKPTAELECQIEAVYIAKLQLYELGILTLRPEQMSALHNGIWWLLTTDGAAYGAGKELLQKLLSAPNGLALVKWVIECHKPEEWVHLKLSNFLYRPIKPGPNLFQALACDLLLAGWFSGESIKIKITEDSAAHALCEVDSLPMPGGTPFAHLLESLALTGYETILQEELERIFVCPGNLLFWLIQLKKDEARIDLFDSIADYFGVHRAVRYHSLLQLLHEMSFKGDMDQQVIARSFLEVRCQAQRDLGLWDCYWITACHIQDFKVDFKDGDVMRSLLGSEANVKAALYVYGGKVADFVEEIKAAAKAEIIALSECNSIVALVERVFSSSFEVGSSGPAGAGAGGGMAAHAFLTHGRVPVPFMGMGAGAAGPG